MECPRTGKPMIEVDINGVKIDVSTGCGGIWFDKFEFQKFDEPHESAGEQLIEISEKYRNDDIDCEKRLQSPRHPDVTMMRYYFSVKRKIEIDECPQCGGIWLDSGELQQIRELFPSSEAKNQAADEYFEQLFSSPEIIAMKERSETDLQKAKRFAHMFHFLCPSYYIPRKQDW
ncbi:MAG: zf-TFIIB domain-containing protein [Xenococcaceae cyanobacterium]